MSDTASSAPCLAKAIASARPIPEPAPVITTTRPLKDSSALRWRARRLRPPRRPSVRDLTLRGANVYAPFASRALDWVSAWFSRPVPASIGHQRWWPTLRCGDSDRWLYPYRHPPRYGRGLAVGRCRPAEHPVNVPPSISSRMIGKHWCARNVAIDRPG